MEKALIQQLEEIVKTKGKVAREMLSSPWSERDKHHALGMLSVLSAIKEVIKKTS